MSTHNMDVEEYINDALEADDTLADNSTLDDDDTLDAEFIEDEKRDKAARPIQAMVRRWRGRKLAREYGKQCFVKEWDPKQECFMYIDTRRFPPVRTFIKPKWLGDDDLPEERQWRSPPGYRERRQKQRGFALVVHTATYTDERLPDLPFAAAVKGEHLKLKEVMQNPFTANFLARDSDFLWEPSKALVLKSFENMTTRCCQHIQSEVKMLQERLERDFFATLDRHYGHLQLPKELPAWEVASSFTSGLRDEKSWRVFDYQRVAVASAAVQQKSASGRAGTSSHDQGEDMPRRMNKDAAAEAAAIQSGQPTAVDLHEATKERMRIFEEWLVAKRDELNTKLEAVRQEKRHERLLKLRAKNPQRTIEDWELDIPASDSDDEGEDEGLSCDETEETRRYRRMANEALQRINRRRLALAAEHTSDVSTDPIVAVYGALGQEFQALKDHNPSADRLLSLIDPHAGDAEARRAAIILQRRFRGWRGRDDYRDRRSRWAEDQETRARAASEKRRLCLAAEEEERRRLRRLAGADPLDQPFGYPWDSRYPSTAQRAVAMRDGVVVIYLKGHVGRLKRSGAESNGDYLLFHDSIWKSPESIQRTCLRFAELAQLVRKLPFRQRLVVLDVVHVETGYPKDDGWAKTRVLYPSASLYADLARHGECVVLGSCLIGASIDVAEEKLQKGIHKKGKVVPASVHRENQNGNNNIGENNTASDRCYTIMVTHPGMAAIAEKVSRKATEGTTPQKPAAKLLPVRWNLDNSKKPYRHAFCENSMVHLKSVPRKYAEYGSLQTIRRQEAESAKRTKRTRGNRDTNRTDIDCKSMEDEDEDMSLLWEGKVSIFGEAFIDALRGEASIPGKDNEDLLSPPTFGTGMVTMKCLFSYLASRVVPSAATVRNAEAALAEAKRQDELAALLKDAGKKKEAAAMKKWRKREEKRLRDDPPRPSQHLVLWSYHQLLCDSLCCFPIPTPPPACSTPIVTEVKYRSIDIAWEVPLYDGEPIIFFEVQRRELTRLTNQWETICLFRDRQGNPVNVTKTRLKIPHLVPGVEIQFRVRGWNHGGFGPFSDESPFYIAGVDQQPEKEIVQLGRLRLFGPQQILNFIAARENQPRLAVQQLGLLQLASLGRNTDGKGSPGAALLRPTVAKNAVAAALRAMRNFPWDRVIQERGCLLLVRLFSMHEDWVKEFARRDEAKRLRKAAKSLRAQQELDDNNAGNGSDDEDENPLSAKNLAGLTKKERAKKKQEAEDMGMMDVMFALASIQLRFGRKDITMLFLVDEVMAHLPSGR